MKSYLVNDAVHLYMSELGAQVVAETGIPSDRYHLGKLMLKTFRTSPEWTLQIDANTDESESSKSVLSRSIRCAYSMQRKGLRVGDVIILMAPNHLDQCIPFYAATYLGIIVYPLDIYLKIEEIKHFLEIGKPKLIFCQSERADDVNAALKSLDMATEIITYDESASFKNFTQFLSECPKELKEDDFQAANLDPESAISCLIPTSGTTGLPKAAATTHKNLIIGLSYFWLHQTEFNPNPTRAIVVSTLQWFSGLLHFYCSAFVAYTRIQTSKVFSIEHYYYIFNVYKPNYIFMNPNLMVLLLKDFDVSKCDFSSAQTIILGGSPVSEELLSNVRKLFSNAVATRAYGMSELSGLAFIPCAHPPNNLGRLIGYLEAKLVDPDTGAEIKEPFKNGEFQVKGPTIFKGYYNRDDATKETFTEDGIWFKTGDLMYTDEHGYYYYVERMKMILKYQNNQISPSELEDVILRHPGVMSVAVTGIPDEHSNDLPVACVVRHSNATVSAQEIKDLVNDSLAPSKQLRGGVVFLDKLPMTVSMKVDRKQLKKVIAEVKRE